MYYKCHKENFKHGGSYIDSTVWIKKKKATINMKNADYKRVQYVATVAFNYEEIKWNPERFSNVISFINKYNQKGISYLSKTDDWKTLEKNNPTITLNILDTKEKTYRSCPAYISKINSSCEK